MFETLDGFAIAEADSGFFQYATVSPDKQRLLPTGVRVGEVDAAELDLPRHARPRSEVLAAQARELRDAAGEPPRWETRRAERRERRQRSQRGGPIPPIVMTVAANLRRSDAAGMVSRSSPNPTTCSGQMTRTSGAARSARGRDPTSRLSPPSVRRHGSGSRGR